MQVGVGKLKKLYRRKEETTPINLRRQSNSNMWGVINRAQNARSCKSQLVCAPIIGCITKWVVHNQTTHR